MFLHKKYILANELVQKMGINIANISMMAKISEDRNNFSTFIKMNNCTFVNSEYHSFPNNIRKGIDSNSFTDMSNKLPCTWVRTEYGITEKELFKAQMIEGKINIAGKEMYVFTDEFVNKMKNKMGYVLNETETLQCEKDGEIDGYTKLAKNKYFTWY